tara:strand:+ start:612 stop:1196 length:585 start_codon:yes stop_codon:yes gene_type:complete
MKFIQKLLAQLSYVLLLVTCVLFSFHLNAQNNDEIVSYIEYKGKVIDKISEDGIASTHLKVKNSTLSTITNNEGEFSLKVPKENLDLVVSVYVLGYETKNIHLDYFNRDYTTIALEITTEKLSEVELFSAVDAKKIVKQTLENKGDNYLNEPVLLTGFTVKVFNNATSMFLYLKWLLTRKATLQLEKRRPCFFI